MNVLKTAIKTLIIIGIFVLLTLSFILYLAVDTELQSVEKHTINANVAQRAQNVLSRVKKSMSGNGNSLKTINQPILLFIKKQELHALTAIFNRSNHFIVMDSNITNTSANEFKNEINNTNNNILSIKVSAKLAELLPLASKESSTLLNTLFPPLFINASIDVLPSKEGLILGTAKIGSLSLSGSLLKYTVEKVLNALQPDLGTQALAIIQSVDIDENNVQLLYQFPDDLMSDGKRLNGRLFALRDELALFGDVNKVRFYYQLLVRFVDENSKTHEGNPNDELKTLMPFVSFMLNQAQKQTAIASKNKQTTFDFNMNSSSGKSSAKSENQAALLALIVYFGSNKFELMIGDISHLSAHEQDQRQQAIQNTSLQNRVDLQQHFIYSMAIKLFSTIQISHTFGELKELLDANLGGSGFSFADLMADRAGTLFADLATSTDESAMKVQRYFTDYNQNTVNLIPEINRLPEGLSQKVFEQKYYNINSKRYQQMLNHIDKQLLTLPLYLN